MTLAPHLSVKELHRRYREAEDPVARSQWQMLWLLAQGTPTAQVATTTGYTVRWVQEVARRYRAGPAAIGDRRHGNPGAAPLLDGAQQERLRGAGRPSPGWGHLDRSPRGAVDRAHDRAGRRSGARLGVDAPPRLHPATPAPPRDPRRSGGAGRLQKRGLAAQVAAVKRAHPTARVTVWAEDEHRRGLLPVVRRVWAPKGQRPTARVERHSQWLYVYGFVRPSTGQSWWCLLPTVNATAFALALATFARDEGIDAAHRAVLVVDQAGWHIAHDLVLPEGIHLALLPAYSPELQPAERLWTLVDEPIANRAFPDLDALEAVLVARYRTLEADPHRLKAHTHFAWWPPELPPVLRR